MRAFARVCVTLAGNLLAATLISFFPLSPKQILNLVFPRTSQLCVLFCKSKEPFLISQQLHTILICPQQRIERKKRKMAIAAQLLPTLVIWYGPLLVFSLRSLYPHIIRWGRQTQTGTQPSPPTKYLVSSQHRSTSCRYKMAAELIPQMGQKRVRLEHYSSSASSPPHKSKEHAIFLLAFLLIAR